MSNGSGPQAWESTGQNSRALAALLSVISAVCKCFNCVDQSAERDKAWFDVEQAQTDQPFCYVNPVAVEEADTVTEINESTSFRSQKKPVIPKKLLTDLQKVPDRESFRKIQNKKKLFSDLQKVPDKERLKKIHKKLNVRKNGYSKSSSFASQLEESRAQIDIRAEGSPRKRSLISELEYDHGNWGNEDPEASDSSSVRVYPQRLFRGTGTSSTARPRVDNDEDHLGTSDDERGFDLSPVRAFPPKFLRSKRKTDKNDNECGAEFDNHGFEFDSLDDPFMEMDSKPSQDVWGESELEDVFGLYNLAAFHTYSSVKQHYTKDQSQGADKYTEVFPPSTNPANVRVFRPSLVQNQPLSLPPDQSEDQLYPKISEEEINEFIKICVFMDSLEDVYNFLSREIDSEFSFASENTNFKSDSTKENTLNRRGLRTDCLKENDFELNFVSKSTNLDRTKEYQLVFKNNELNFGDIENCDNFDNIKNADPDVKNLRLKFTNSKPYNIELNPKISEPYNKLNDYIIHNTSSFETSKYSKDDSKIDVVSRRKIDMSYLRNCDNFIFNGINLNKHLLFDLVKETMNQCHDGYSMSILLSKDYPVSIVQRSVIRALTASQRFYEPPSYLSKDIQVVRARFQLDNPPEQKLSNKLVASVVSDEIRGESWQNVEDEEELVRDNMAEEIMNDLIFNTAFVMNKIFNNKVFDSETIRDAMFV